MSELSEEIAATAARIVVEEGQDYGAAKRRAAKQMGVTGRAELPSNDQVEAAVFEYIEIFCGDTQPGELRALRELAAIWMERLAEFRPHLSGAVWRGTATRLSDIHLQLYCDDSKSAEILLLNKGIDYEVGSTNGPRGQMVDRLSMSVHCPALQEHIGLHLTILDADDLVDALGASDHDARGGHRMCIVGVGGGIHGAGAEPFECRGGSMCCGRPVWRACCGDDARSRFFQGSVP